MRVQIMILKRDIGTVLIAFLLVLVFGICFSFDFIKRIPLCEAPTLAEANIHSLEILSPDSLPESENTISVSPVFSPTYTEADGQGHTALGFRLNQETYHEDWAPSSRQIMFWTLESATEELSLEPGTAFIDSFRLPRPDDGLEEIDMSLLSQEYCCKYSKEKSCNREDLLSSIRGQKEQPSFQPSPWPTHGWISSPFGYRTSPFTGRIAFHKGIDIAARFGTPIYAVSQGIVAFSGRRGEYGNVIIIQHACGFSTLYGHNSINVVKSGNRVECGQLIGYVGNTGRSTAPHLHYEIMKDGRCINPRKYLLAKLF